MSTRGAKHIWDEQYVSFVSFRRSGAAVPTPVWIVGLRDGTAGFTTEPGAGKLKRIAANPHVTLQPCSMRGTVRPGSAAVPARAEIVTGDEARQILRAIRRKYFLVSRIYWFKDLVNRLRGRDQDGEVAVLLRFG